MKTIGELWQESGHKSGLRVRWNDWGQKYNYFEIESLDENKQCLKGKLCNGEELSYALNSKDWKLYEPGDELSAKAV